MSKGKIYRLEIRLDYQCNKKLKVNCKKSKLTKSEYLRKLIMSEAIKEKSDDRFYESISKLIKIGDKLKIIAEKAEYLNYIDKEKYTQEVQKINELITLLRIKYL